MGQNGSVFWSDVDVMQQTRGPWVKEGRRPHGPFQGDDSAGVRTEDDVEAEALGISLHRLFSFYFLHPLPLQRVCARPFIVTGLSVHGGGGRRPQVHYAIQ